jgi:hypothetical protein
LTNFFFFKFENCFCWPCPYHDGQIGNTNHFSPSIRKKVIINIQFSNIWRFRWHGDMSSRYIHVKGSERLGQGQAGIGGRANLPPYLPTYPPTYLTPTSPSCLLGIHSSTIALVLCLSFTTHLDTYPPYDSHLYDTMAPFSLHHSNTASPRDTKPHVLPSLTLETLRVPFF